MQRCHTTIIGIFLVVFSMSAFAEWQVSRPTAVIPQHASFHAAAHYKDAPIPVAYINAPLSKKPISFTQVEAPTYAISISGSLKENVERIMGRYHWRVIWKAPYDYNFDGRVTGSSLASVIEKLFHPFPLQAVMYMSNRTLTVVSKK